jgi:hypothetical protein
MAEAEKTIGIQNDAGQTVNVIAFDPALLKDPLLENDRITCRLVYYHEHRGYEPIVVEKSYSGFLETYELEPQCKRLNKVLPEWKPLPIGDLEVDQVGDVILQNLAGINLSIKPTPEQQAEYEKQTIRIRKAGCEDGIEIVVLPGRLEKVHADKGVAFEIKCDHGEGRGYLWVFPR